MNIIELLDENRFWAIIESTLDKSKDDYEMQQEELKEILMKLEPNEILRF